MFTKIKNYLVLSSTSLMLVFTLMAPVGVSAACNAVSNQIANGASQATPGDGAGGTVDCGAAGAGTEGLGKLAKNVVNIFSFVIGAIAVIMIIYGGFRYITSGGSSDGVGAAKNTLIYAIIGLIIVALAQVIVQFVLTQSNAAIE